MKTQISKASHGLAKYSEEYKQQALELWRKSGRSANKVAAELGIRPSLLYKWSTDARQTQGGQAARGVVGRQLDVAQIPVNRQRCRHARVGRILVGHGGGNPAFTVQDTRPLDASK